MHFYDISDLGKALCGYLKESPDFYHILNEHEDPELLIVSTGSKNPEPCDSCALLALERTAKKQLLPEAPQKPGRA